MTASLTEVESTDPSSDRSSVDARNAEDITAPESFGRRWQRVPLGPLDSDDPDLRRYARSVAVAAVAATISYLYLIQGLFNDRIFSNFYDLQARALLDGRIDVPAGSLGIEAFVNDGRHYLYFPPGPALLRAPLLAVTDRFDGRLTTLSMLLAWTATVVLVALLMWRVRRMVRGDAPLGRSEAAGYGFLLFAGTAGSVVLFLGSIPWVYHEAYAWAIAMALGFAFCLLGVAQRPTTWGIVGAGAFALGAVLSRTTAGWACAFALILSAIFLPRLRGNGDRHLWWKLWLAGTLPIVAGAAVNWAKFRHPYLFPIDQQVFTTVNQQRRDAIAANGGDLFNPNLILSTLVNYFRPNGIRFVSIFPYITLPPHIAPSYGGGFLDQANRTGSIVAFTPLLFGLSVWGVLATLRPRARETMRRLRLPLLGMGGIPLGVMFYAYIAHRYTSEFTPLLILGATIGFVEIARRLEGRTPVVRRAALAVMGALALFSGAASLAAAINTQALANPDRPVLRDYVARQAQLSGGALSGYIRQSDELPTSGPADRIHIVGDCTAYFIGTGDEFRPWSEIDTRDERIEITPVAGPAATQEGVVDLARFEGLRTTALRLERQPLNQFRLVLAGGGADEASPWFTVDAGDRFAVDIAGSGIFDYLIEIDGVEDAPSLTFGRESRSIDWRFQPNVLAIEPLTPITEAAGLRIAPPERLEGCDDLLALGP